MNRIEPYEKTDWQDHIIDVTNGQVIQEGTRFNQTRANKIENGIEYNRNLLISQASEIQRLKVQLEITGRVPSNSGAFFDTLDQEEPNKLVRQTTSTDIIVATLAGATELSVDSVEGFVAFTQVTVYDETSSEDVLITAVDTINKKLIVQALINGYVKGAKVARSNTKIANNQMTLGDWGTYSVAVSEVV
ncbi:hypothetical protein [Metabacillus fastidiosus]|uniref:Uncharacterized protein n=1 Tax=Metabacillus fastidiosus TaxID=1458 RepID=A0ABU6NRH8_9BACI|nr:hypothetical protein [Metabacillus fastidiosus]